MFLTLIAKPYLWVFEMKWLITGGAGYIGAHVEREFLLHGDQVSVLDSMLLGKAERISTDVEFFQGDISNSDFVSQVMKVGKFDGVVNLAGLKSVDESRLIPDEYHRVNCEAVALLLEVAVKNNVNYFLQSSTAAVYGNGRNGLAKEGDEIDPISPYGRSKFEAEKVLNNYIKGGQIRGASLRYFNVAGSREKLLRDSSTANLIPKAIQAVAKGVPPVIFGDDYETPDGTCIRDYVHVEDVARGHHLAIAALRNRQIALAINIGTGTGYSVRQVLNTVLEVSKSQMQPVVKGRRAGDPAKLIADVELAKTEIGFVSQMDLKDMVSTS